MSAIVESSYDQIAGWYNSRRHVWSNRRELDEFASRLPRGGRVLDVGCGPGYAVKLLTRKGFRVTGIDVSREMLELARKKVPKATFLRQDMRKLDFPPRSFDGIVCLYSIIHVPRHNHEQILFKFRELLKEGGILLLCTGWGPLIEVEENWLGSGARMYWSHFDAETNLSMVREARFRRIWSRASHKRDGTHLFVLAEAR